MVYHYTNFVWETNAWWLRRVRPVWMGLTGIWLYWVGCRYYFFGKVQAHWQTTIPDEEWIARAQINKRNWGHNAYYKPELPRSRKRAIQEAQGENYRYASPWAEMYMVEKRTLEQVQEEENNWE